VADREQLGHVFLNLIDNAITYRDPSRKLVIEINGAKLGSGGCSYTVSDNGIGLTPEEMQGKIWELFYRAAPKGSAEGEGVGLTISKRIVEKHGGSIKASPAPGGGTAFTMELPG
jgi:signal transduction histidine kinase